MKTARCYTTKDSFEISVYTGGRYAITEQESDLKKRNMRAKGKKSAKGKK